LLRATPNSVPVKVFDEILVSRVTSRPLSLEEIRDKGIAIDESNFRVVEFDVTLVLRGRSFRVNLPVAAPKAKLSTEIIPAAELEERTAELDRINRDLSKTAQIPPEFAAEMPDFRINPINFEEVLDGEGEDKKGIPITGLLVIPGNIAFLNQFFSVQLFTENAAPPDSGLVVQNLRASIRLPAGSDGIPARSYSQPGDDPLRMARVGPDRIVQTNLPVVLPGTDGLPGTDDDITRLRPGDTGTAEFLVEGLREGLHLLDIDLEAELEGLAAGPTRIRGRTSGSVLVRNANFSMTFAHPFTVRTGEPYEASVTLLNTGDFTANLVSVALNRLAISGAVLLSDEKVELGNLAPGESATATFRFRSQRTGSVYFSNLTTSDDSVRGRLQLFAGVDERGVALSPDSIGYPDWVTALPPELFAAANRVLGQALSVATAGRLPEGVRKLTSRIVEERVIELAEAGQRLRYDDDPRRVLIDLALDWQGGRTFDSGFDQILRETQAGREWRDAIALAQESRDTSNAPQRLGALADSLAGLGQSWWIVSSGNSALALTAQSSNASDSAPPPLTDGNRSTIPQSLAYAGSRGLWLASKPDTNLVFTGRATASIPSLTLGFLETGADGHGERFEWTLANLNPGDALTFQPSQSDTIRIQRGTQSFTIAPIRTAVQESPPSILSARQDISVVSDRVHMRCPIREYGNWGTVLAVLFSKPMSPADVEAASAYQFPDGNGARTVKLQPGGRVCLLQLHRGIASFSSRPREYSLGIASLPDPRGNRSQPVSLPVLTTPAKGASLRGRVYGVDGNPVAGVPVTLTMQDRVGNKCVPAEFRAGQVFTDDNGYFTLDFVLADVPFTLAAIDTSRMSDADARTLLGVLLEAVGPNGADRPTLEALTQDPNTRAAMLRAFHLGEIGPAIVAAEGLDRAVYRDLIPQRSGRDGSELSVALRFRGRGSISGRILASNGAPLPGAAVNLFPDSDSRELGRGVFTEADGSFVFHGVPLGEFSLHAEVQDGRSQLAADRLLVSGETRVLELRLPDLVERFGSIRGLVIEPDGTPHPHAQVLVAQEVQSTLAKGLVASSTADASGAFLFPRIPATNWVVVAISADGRRRGFRNGVRVTEGGDANLLLALESTATLRGIVRYWDNSPAPNAKVGGGDRVVRSDANGRFELPGVPLGVRTIVAGVDGPDAKDGVTRLGSLQLSVVPLGNDEITLRLNALGRIRGVVYDSSGTKRVPNVRVAIPATGGFYWVNANSNGEYEFNGFGLGSYIVSAPSPPVKKNAEALAAEALDAIGQARSGSSPDEAAALVGQLANLYSQGSIGRLTTTDYSPGTWGFQSVTLDFDGQTAIADVRYLPGASVRGTVVNHQDVPIAANVTVYAFGPNKFGGPSIREFGPFLSGASDGAFSAGGFLVGPYRVVAQSPLLVGEGIVEGRLTPLEPHPTNLLVRFPPQRDVTGRLTGVVLNPDGSTVTRGVVQISFAPDYVIATDTNGFFDTQIRLPSGNYFLTATNLETSLVGQSSIQLVGGITNFATIPLLGKGDLVITVLDTAGVPSPQTQLRLQRPLFPSGESLELTTDARGSATFSGLWEGDWQVAVERLSGVNKAIAQVGTQITPGVTNVLTVALGPVATISGRFLTADSNLPITGAQVTAHFRQLKGPVYGSAPTDAHGDFALPGLPVDSYFLVARHPVSGRIASAEVRLLPTETLRTVTLVEQALGEIVGTLVSGEGTQGVSGATLQFSGSDSLAPSRIITTDPSGAFRFSNVPLGRFHLSAFEPTLKLSGSLAGELTEANSPLHIELPLEGLATAEITVLEPDGTSPATNATVTLSADKTFFSDTDESGRSRFRDLRLGRIRVSAQSNRVGQRNSTAVQDIHLTRAGQSQSLTLQLSGVAQITGTVRDANNQPAPNAAIEFTRDGSSPRQALSDAHGQFTLSDLPLGSWRLQATLGALAAFDSGSFSQGGESIQRDLRLGSSATLTGTVIREQGGELSAVEVAFFFTAQNGRPGFARATTDIFGRFQAPSLPVGIPIRVRVDVPSLDGRTTLTTNLTAHGQILDVGILRLDQTSPRLLTVDPADGTIDVPPRPTLTLTFSEPIRPESLRPESIQLTQGTNVTLVDVLSTNGPSGPNSQWIVLPRSNLLSARPYNLFVLGADQVDASGRPVSFGPEDHAERPLPSTVTTAFTIRDFEPPMVLGAFPPPNADNIEPDAPVRFEFNEPIRTHQLSFVVRSPQGPVNGSWGINANQRLIAWIPDRRLEANTRYQIELTGVVDLARNEALPITNRFTTLDTLGPRIAELRLAPGQRPVANATVTVEALLASPETGAIVRFARNGTDLGIATEGPTFRWPARLPAEGTVRLSATALDIGGNPGETAILELRVGPNERPTVFLTRLEPPSGPLETGRRFSFAATPSDDATVSALRITASGALSLTREVFLPPNGKPTSFLFDLPLSFVAGDDIVFRVIALDDSGAASEEASLTFATVDATRPELSLEAPLDGSTIDPRQPLALTLNLRDNSRSAVAEIELAGVVSNNQRFELALEPNTAQALPIRLSLTNGLDGGNLRMTARVRDAAGNRTEIQRAYSVRSVIGPKLRFISAVDRGSSWFLPTSQPLSPWVDSVAFYFDRALAVRPGDTNLLQLTNDLGAAVAFIPRVSSSGAFIELAGPSLPPGSTLTLRLLPGLTDTLGNPILMGDGSEIPPDGIAVTFRIAQVQGLDIPPGTAVVPGQTFLLPLVHQSAFPRWEVLLNDIAQPVHQSTTNGTTFRLTLPSDARQARVRARNAVNGRPPLELPPVDIAVRSRDADDDADGLPNGWEADRSWRNGSAPFNPFDSSDASRDGDFDQLDNRTEFERGTDPFLADTDGDGLSDGRESTRGNCPDPFVIDSDGDGIRDGDDLAPCVAGESLTLEPLAWSVPEGTSQTNTITVTAVGLTPLSVAFASHLPKPAFVDFADFSSTGTNPIRRQIVVRPSFADAGEYSVHFTVTGRRTTSAVTTNFQVRLTVVDQANTRFTRWAQPQSGSWNQPSNWTAGLPGVGTNAIIDLPGDYTVTLNQPAFTESLTLGAARGTQVLDLGNQTLTLNGASHIGPQAILQLRSSSRLSGQGTLRVDGRISVENGTLEGAGLLEISSGGTLGFESGTGTRFPQLSRSVENSGLVQIGTNVGLSLGSIVVSNRPSGRWHLDSGGMRWAAGSPRFVNHGEFLKRGTNSSSVYFIELQQHGRLQIDSGELALDSVPFTFSSTSTNTGAGTLRLNSSRGDLFSTFDFPRGLVLANSTLTNHTDQSWSSVLFLNSSLAGPGSVIVTRDWTLQSSLLLGTGQASLAREAQATVSGTLNISRPFSSLGQFRLATNTIVYLESAQFRNEGTFEIADTANFRYFSTFGSGTLENHGTLRKSGAGALRFSGVALRNLGRFELRAGTAHLDFAAENSGRIDLEASARLEASATLIHGSSSWLGGDGSLTFSGGTHNVLGTLQPRGGLTVSGGNVTVRNTLSPPGSTTVTGGTLAFEQPQEFLNLSLRNGELTSTAPILVRDTFEWTSGTVRTRAPLSLATNVLGRVRNASLAGTLENAGRLEVDNNASLRFEGGTLINRGDLRLLGSTSFNAQFGLTNLFRNEGLFQTGTQDVRFVTLPVDLQGSVQLTPIQITFGPGTNRTDLSVPAGGKLDFQESFSHLPGSRLAGAGTVAFSAGRHDILGAMEVQGDLTFGFSDIRILSAFTNTARAVIRCRTLDLEKTVRLRDVTADSGTISLGNRLSISRSLTWNGGRFIGTGTLLTEPTAVVRLSGFGDKALAANFEANGDVEIGDNSRVYLIGGTWRIPQGATNLVLGSSQFWLQGNNPPGLFENLGTLRKTGPGTFDVDAPLSQAGQFLIENGIADLAQNNRFSSLTRIAQGAELRLGAGTNIWSSGTRFEGSGSLGFPSPGTVLQLQAPIELDALSVRFENGTRIQGEFPLRSGPNGSVTFRSGTFEIEGALAIHGRMSVTLGSTVRIDDDLSLATGATLDNQGRRDSQNRSNIRVRGFSNSGGTVLGIPPDVVPAVSPLQFRLVPPDDSPSPPRLARAGTGDASDPRIELSWQPNAQRNVVIECSADLLNWHPVELNPNAQALGAVSIPLPTRTPDSTSPAKMLFFRQRQSDW